MLDLTQSDLARQVGCSEITIRKIESGERTPSRQVAELLATCLSVPPSDRSSFIAYARGIARPSRSPQPPIHSPSTPSMVSPLASLTRLLGREQDIEQVRARLLEEHVRLLTLVGPPGIGKTRLGLYIAEQLQSEFADGVCVVSLAPIRDPSLVLPTLISTLSLRHRGDQLPLATLATALRNKHMLLVFDNAEHVLGAAPQIAELLRMAPRLKALVTSRSALHISGEQLHTVAPLALPDTKAQRSPEQLLESSPAIQLFVERLRAVQPNFTPTPENLVEIANLCRRLDGVPLAIELAAARGRLFAPGALLARISGSTGSGALGLLVDGPYDLPAHQRTLRSTIDWSYALLEPAEREIFAQLGVFVGSFTAEAVEAICQTSTDFFGSVLDILMSLVRHSLLQVEVLPDGQSRFSLFETLREYAQLHLNKSPQQAATQQRHAAYYRELTLTALKPCGCIAKGQDNCLRDDDNNIRAALEWHAQHDPLMGLHWAAVMRTFWLVRCYLSEGRTWLARFFALGSAQLTTDLRADALFTIGFLAYHQGDSQQANKALSESLELYQQIENQQGIANALLYLGRVDLLHSGYERAEQRANESLAIFRRINDLGNAAEALRCLSLIAKDRGDMQRAEQLSLEGIQLYRQAGDRWGVARSLYNLSSMAYWQNDLERSEQLAEQAADYFEELDDTIGLAYAIEGIGMVAYKQARYEEAEQALKRSLALMQGLEEQVGIALMQHELGLVELARGRYESSIIWQRQALELAWNIGERRRVAFCLEGLAAALMHSQPLKAVHILGKAEAMRETIGTPLPPSEQASYRATIANLRTILNDDEAFELAWQAGRAQPPAEAIKELLASLPSAA